MRLFTAVMPAEPALEHLEEFLEPRREHARFRWTLAEQFHLTLGFHEPVRERNLDALLEGLADVVAKRAPFDLQIAGGGAFPHPAQAKVLVADVAGDRAALERLATSCRGAANHAGVPVDGQRFRPHVTVARMGRGTEVTKWVRLLDAYRGPTWRVDEVSVIESHLGEGPRRRPRYEVVAQVPFGLTS